MNPQPELQSETLRSEIDSTRERMDETIDALESRLEGRHLVDELIGFFRGEGGAGAELRGKLSNSAGTAVHSVMDAVKAHPIPVALTGVGIAWLIYEMRAGPRAQKENAGDEFDYSAYGEQSMNEAGPTYVSGQDYEESEDEALRAEMSGDDAQSGGKLAEMTARAKEKAATMADRGREVLGATKERLSGVTGAVQQRGREAFQRSRQRITKTTEQHPLEVGLALLAAGAIVGLMLPTPQVVNRRVGPTVDRLRSRARDASSELLQKGKRVVQAAATAAKVEAKTQGLSVPRRRDESGVGGSAAPASSGAPTGSSEEGATGI